MHRVREIFLNVVFVLIILVAANARPSSTNTKGALRDLRERQSRSTSRKELLDQQELPGLKELLQGLPHALQGLQNSGRHSRDLSFPDGNSKSKRVDFEQDTIVRDNGHADVSNAAVEAVEAAVAKLVGEKNGNKVKRSGDQEDGGPAGDNQFIVTVVDRNVVVVDGQNDDDEGAKLTDGESRGTRSAGNEGDEDYDWQDSEEDDGDQQEADDYDDDWQEADEDEGDSQGAVEEKGNEEDEEDVNDESEVINGDAIGTDDLSNDNDQVEEQDDDIKDIKDENEGKGKTKREIVTQIEKTLSDVRFLDDYLEYLNKRADQLEELQQDLGKYNGNRKEESDRSKRESAKLVNDRPVDYLKSLPQYRDVPREVLINAVQSLTNTDHLSRHLEPKEPVAVQRQAPTESPQPIASPVSPCVATSKEPLTKEEQELQRVIELRKKHEANVAREQDEVVKAEHMAHTMQQDMQEVMAEIRQLKKEIAIERKEAEAISTEVKEDQQDLEEHDQKKFNARRNVDELYMKLTELESNDCEARNKRQLVRQLRDIVGNERVDPYENPRQRILRQLQEKEREQAELDRMREAMRERSVDKFVPEKLPQGIASDVQDAQKQVRELQRAHVGSDDQQNADDSQEAPSQQDQQQAEDADPAEIQSNELVQRSVNAQSAAGAQASPMPRQAATECTTASTSSGSTGGSKNSQYNAILQEIIIGEAKVKIEAVEVERAEQEVASSRKRMATALSKLSALVIELRNLQIRAVSAGKKAKEAHLVLAYHDQLLFSERRKVTEALNLETDLQKMISDLKTKTGKCSKEPK